MQQYKNYKGPANEDATDKHRGLMTAKMVQRLNSILDGATRLATTTLDGLLSAADKTKLDALNTKPYCILNVVDSWTVAGYSLFGNAVAFNETADPFGMHTAGAGNVNIVVPRAGLWRVSFEAIETAASNDNWFLLPRVNGVDRELYYAHRNANWGYTEAKGTALFNLAANSTVALVGYFQTVPRSPSLREFSVVWEGP